MTTATYSVLTEEQFASMAYDKPVKHEPVCHPVSSVIVSEELLCEPPVEHTVRYVEVPVVEEVTKTVPVVSIVELEKIVPRYEIQYVEKIVEVPEVQYIDRHEEKEHIEEVIREIPGETEIREVNHTVVRKVPQVQYVNMERIVEVPGAVVTVEKDIELLPPVKKYKDVEVPVVVAQTIRPVITTSEDFVDVDVFEYEPQITPIDVFVATPIQSKLVAVGGEQDVHNCVSIPPVQYNTILKSLNTHIKDEESEQLPFIKINGVVGFLSPTEAPGYAPLQSFDQVVQPKEVEGHYAQEEMEQHKPQSLYPETGYLPGYEDDIHEDKFRGDSMGLPPKKPAVSEKKKRTCGC